MGKLGKKARKFAKKNLQSVHKKQRKTKIHFKRRPSSSSKGQRDVEDRDKKPTALIDSRDHQVEEFENVSLDDIFTEDDSDVAGDASDSDGFLSEDLSWSKIADTRDDNDSEDFRKSVAPSVISDKVEEELALHKKKLNRLREKDPEFTKFLASHEQEYEVFQDEEMDSDEETRSSPITQLHNQDSFVVNMGRVLNKSLINSWCQSVKEESNESALTSLLNVYRAACHYGNDTVSQQRIKNGEIFSRVIILVLREADNIFRSVLKIPSASSKKGVILEMKNTPIWKVMKPFIISYLRSTLFLLNQMTDSEILAFALGQLRASLILFAPFPSLLHRLIKVSVKLWASSEGILSSSSFLIIRDVAVVFNTEYFDVCIIKTFKAYIAHSNAADSVYSKHLQFLRNSFVVLCGLDVQRACAKAVLSIERLTNIFKHGLRTKKKETLKKICSAQYANCIDLWVTSVTANIRDHDLHQLYYVIVQLINGVACLFPGPRYFPLRVKCILWLNFLSSSSGIFVPVASLVLDILEYKVGKEGGKSKKSGKNISHSSVLKLPKHWLKSRNFQEECFSSAIELLCCHFAQWSYHISFPEVATIPLIRLKKFHEVTTVESFKRLVKRFIDQVEQNVEFVRKKRDEVPFSPKDHALVESFLQLEKGSINTPFTQYYKSVIEKAASRDLSTRGRQSSLEPKERKRKRGASGLAP